MSDTAAEPTAAAKRCALMIMLDFPPENSDMAPWGLIDQIANSIDRETRLPELIAERNRLAAENAILTTDCKSAANLLRRQYETGHLPDGAVDAMMVLDGALAAASIKPEGT